MTILNEQTFDDFISSDKVVVNFSAAWCGPCRMMAPLLEELESKNPGKIAKVDVDTSSVIAAKYGIKSIPTTLVFEKGILIDKKTGVLKESDITTMLN